MKRREFFEKAGVGSAALLGTAALGAGGAAHAPKQDDHGHGEGHGEPLEGPLASATITFGQWQTPFDRVPPANPTDRTRNNHALLPSEVKIKAGGAINFIISGFHHVLIYANKEPGDIDRTNTRGVTNPPGPPLINDPSGRVYRGLDPSTLNGVQDRVEAVTLKDPGRYLAMCGVLPHFFDAATGQFVMFGFIDVLP